jgi:hypothetical protein
MTDQQPSQQAIETLSKMPGVTFAIVQPDVWKLY